MPLQLDDYEALAKLGVQQFWTGRSKVLAEDEDERAQGGERDGVLGGKNMDGFLSMVTNLVQQNGLPDASIFTKGRPDLTLPGYFRPTKLWDVVVMDGRELVAGIEFKSHVGSFGNNFNNRAEEALGTATDTWAALKNGVINQQPQPFLGWLILVEDCDKSRCPVRASFNNFPVAKEFIGPEPAPKPVHLTKSGRPRKSPPPRKTRLLISYLQRYDMLCRRLVEERLYTHAALLASPRSAAADGEFSDVSSLTSLKAFAAMLAGHIQSWAARKQGSP